MPYNNVNKSAYFGVRVPGTGPEGRCKIMLVGERPGIEEAMSKPPEPFVGAAGRILNALLAKVGIHRPKCWVTNLVKTYEDADPTEEEVTTQGQELVREIQEKGPEYVVALGAFAVRWFLGDEATMDLVHGIPHSWNGGQAIVVPVYHPAAGLYNPNDLALTYWDLSQASLCVRGKLLPPADPLQRTEEYLEWQHATISGGYFPTGKIAMDTEFNRGKPWGGSLSVQPGQARVFKPGDGVVVGSEAKVLLHHALADLGMLEAMGVTIEEEQVEDSMMKAYALAGVHPLGLKPLAYRLAGMEMQDYDEVIREADRGLAIAYLEGAQAQANGNGWGGKEGGKQSLDQRIAGILKAVDSGKMDKDGKPVDPRKRWQKIRAERPDWAALTVLEQIMGEMPEATLDDIPRDKAVWYSGRDADATLRVDEELDRQMDEMEVRRVYELDMSVIPAVDRMRRVGLRMDPAALWLLQERMRREMQAIANGLGFNPDSGDQVAVYLFTVLGLKSRRQTKGGSREATDDKVLEALFPQHPDVEKIIDYRERSKIKSIAQALLESMDDGHRIHSDLMQRANSGRFTAKEPNLLALPTRTELGSEIRAAAIPADGCVFGDWDYNQIEMRIMADESEDEELCRLFRQGKDVHANTACRMFGVTMGQMDDKRHRYPAKRVGFGVITGITGHGLVEQMNLAGANRDGRWTEENCDEMIEEFKSKIYPGVGRYMRQCGDEARRYGYVRDRWGRIRYLPGVWVPIGRVRKEAERAAHSHKIQGGAAGLIKTAIANLWPQFKEWRRRGYEAEMLLPVHDELLMEIEDDHGFKAKVAEAVTRGMQEAARLRVPVKADGQFGRSWKEAH